MPAATPQPTPFAPDKEITHWYQWLISLHKHQPNSNGDIIVTRGTALPVYPYRP